MKKFSLSLLSVIISAIMVFGVFPMAFADEEASGNQVNFSILDLNVAGLPIPSAFSSDGKVVPTAEKAIGQKLNESGYDIICVQEDFQYHAVLSAQLTNYDYKTYTTGGIPYGSGLNIFSKYPIYNAEQVAWNDYNGILTAANDGLTPKGFLKVTADIDGVLVDIYDLHADANGSHEDCMAKKAQFTQLSEYIDKNSADRPVIITGDYNATLHSDDEAEMYEILMQGEGFKDAWSEVVNGGNYLRGEDRDQLINDYYTKYDGLYWGIWDSVERFLYRNGDGAVLTALTFEYEQFTDSDGNLLSDHNAAKSLFSIDISGYTRPEITLEKLHPEFFLIKFFRFVKYFFRDIYLILKDLPNVM